MFEYLYSLFGYTDYVLSPKEQEIQNVINNLKHLENQPPVYTGLVKEEPLPAVARNAPDVKPTELFSSISLNDVLFAIHSLKHVETRPPIREFPESDITKQVRLAAQRILKVQVC